MTHFGARDDQATAILDVEFILSFYLRNLRATDLISEALALDSSFGRVDDVAFDFDRTLLDVQQISAKD